MGPEQSIPSSIDNKVFWPSGIMLSSGRAQYIDQPSVSDEESLSHTLKCPRKTMTSSTSKAGLSCGPSLTQAKAMDEYHSDRLLVYSTKDADGSAPGSEAYLRQAAESSDITFIDLSKTSPEMQIAYWRSLVESRKRGASYFILPSTVAKPNDITLNP
jgi:hypothetical protein